MEERNNRRTQLICLLCGHFFLSNFFFLVALGWLGFYFSISITPFHYPLSLLLSFCYLLYINLSYQNFFPQKIIVQISIISIISSLLLQYLLSFVYDISWDGTEYQQAAIIDLKNGWNPLLNPFKGIYENDLIVYSYAKASWIAESALYSFFGNIQSAKVLHFTLMASTGFLVASFLMSLQKLSRYTILFVSIAVVFNPITISQFFTFYLDGILYLCLVSMIILLIEVFKNGTKIYLLTSILFCIHLISTLKFTGLVYAGVLTFFFLLAHLTFKTYKKTLYLTILLAVMHISVLFTTGYNPYMTNTIQNNHPFYPINKIKIPACSQMPANFCDQNRFYNFAYSILSRTQNTESPYHAALKFPFTYKLGEVSTHPIADARVGGFGLLFSGILLLSCLLVFDTLKNNPLRLMSASFWLCYLLIGLSVSVFINPHPWWARYVPQFYIAPIIILIFSNLISNSKLSSITRKLLLIALLLNSYLTLEGTIRQNLPASLKINDELNQLKKTEKTVELFYNRASIKTRLTDQSINVITIQESDLVNKKIDTLSYLLPVQRGVYSLK